MYLKRFNDETQISEMRQRKSRTEESVVMDCGTMQESGVSKLVSVRVDDGEELVASK
ncbi:hypothetical protein [Bacillus sp. S2-R3J1-FB-BA1]|uniref:hypothetical protein n=1 Tax=Bacillus sp. S2-R3J1-FB-BA1 TaxID=1973490 RepID=UPI001593C4ED|nr:hypothetical protein [Bacillus sp. S2-R3J1-FB-BA1]